MKPLSWGQIVKKIVRDHRAGKRKENIQMWLRATTMKKLIDSFQKERLSSMEIKND